MFWHIFHNRFKCLLGDRFMVFWTFLYPILLGTLFFLAFSNLNSGVLFHRIPIAVVDNAEYRQNAGFKQVLASVSENSVNSEDPLFQSTVMDQAQADEALKGGSIKGYILFNGTPQIVVKESGIEQTILKQFMDSYLQIGSAYKTILSGNPAAQNLQYTMPETGTYLAQAGPVKSPNITLIFFYALIAMASMFGGLWGNKEICDTQADLSPQGARLNLSPVNKLKAMAYSMSASVAMQFLSEALLVAYLTLVLRIDFGNNLLYVLVACLFGSVAGVAFGAMIGAIVPKSEKIKHAVLISVSLLMSYMAGLMVPSVKYAVTQAVPVLKYINPANLITDALYSLYYYSSHTRFFMNIGLLIAFCALCTLIVFFKTRRQNMQVYKAYFKIIKKHAVSIAIYFFIFAAISTIITKALAGTSQTSFGETKCKVAFYDEDASPLTKGLEKYLLDSAVLVPVDNNAQSIQDALFFGEIDYVLRIPAGFTADFQNGSNRIKLQRTAAPNSTTGVYMDYLIDKYLGTTSLYSKNLPQASQSQIAQFVSNDLSQKASVTLDASKKQEVTESLSYYFRYLAYSLLAVLIMGVTSFMMTFNEKELSERNQCSPMPPIKMNLQIVLGNLTFGLAIWALLCALLFLQFGSVPLNMGTLLFLFNSLAFMLVSLSIGFLAGKFVKNTAAQGAFTNVISLGISFLSGIFVEQAMLGKTVLAISSFTPGYWYVKAVDAIRGAASFDLESVTPAINGILIQLGFAIALILIALLVTKQRKSVSA